MLATAVGQLQMHWLARRVRQQAGSYRFCGVPSLCVHTFPCNQGNANKAGRVPNVMIFGKSSIGTCAEQRPSLQIQGMPLSTRPFCGSRVSM